MTIRVGRIPFINAEPFYTDMERRGLQVQDILPSDIAGALRDGVRDGVIDAGLVPLVDTFHLGDRFEPISGFCIASNREARSVLFYAKQPIERMREARIGVNSEACTSLHLLKILLLLKYKVQPKDYVSIKDENDAFILTDDQALRQRRGAFGYPHRYDLDEEWFQWTGLPFVHSRWFTRKDMEPGEALLLEDTLYVGMEEGVQSLFDGSEPRNYVLMLPRDIAEYIRGFHFFMGLADYKAAELFSKYLDCIESGSKDH